MIIAVDTGNKMVKTETAEFHAGVEVLDQMPGEQEEVLTYDGQYYRITSRRISYMEDKTEDDRYFILTLFAIAKELEKNEIQEKMVPSGLIDVKLLVGLPPAHYGRQRRSFFEYFYRDGEIISFAYKNNWYKIAFSDVKVYIQAYAAYCLIAGQRRLFTYPKVLVIDIGGFTVDYMILRFGCLEPSYVDSLEEGVIKMYRLIKAGIRQRYSILLEETDIDNIITGEKVQLALELQERVKEIAVKHVTELLGIFRELGIDFKTTQTVFVGGGAILLSEFIQEIWKKYQGEYFIINDTRANAKGYRLQYQMECKEEAEENEQTGPIPI